MNIRKFNLILITLILVILTGCSSAPTEKASINSSTQTKKTTKNSSTEIRKTSKKSSASTKKATKPSSASAKKTKEYSKKHALTGKASWYGKKFHGRLTASGERYSVEKFTAAHKTLPFGTVVRVTNTITNKSVDVKINDRGPYIKGRIIDLSPTAFNQIARVKQGVIPVKVTIIDDSNTFRYKH